jgi:ferrous iron transport protein B
VTAACHDGGAGTVGAGASRIALIGAPNAGKTSVFNALTGLRGRTGNYPGVTVSRFVGVCRVGRDRFVIEDLPGSYGLEPVSPDEQIMVDVLDGRLDGVERPDALLVVVDATTLRRSLGFVGQVLARGLPAGVVVTFVDNLARRQGALDVEALGQALGVPVFPVVGHRGHGITQLRAALAGWPAWPVPVLAPPADPVERDAWAESVLAFAGYRAAEQHRVT